MTYSSYGSYGSYSHYGYNSYGYDCYGYDRDGYDKSGYDCSGYDKGGYSKSGYDCDGYDKGGYDCDGYDKGGRDCDGYDRDGCGPDQPEEPTEGDCGEPVTVTLMTEDFSGLCTPDDSDNVASDSGWKSYYGGAYADGCNDGALVFGELDSADLDSVTLTFDIVSSNVCNFEAEGCNADAFTVEFFNGSTWEVLDVFVRDGYEMVGSVSGQSFGACDFSELTYTISDPGDVTQFRFTADFTASNEAILVDNVLVTGEYTEDCGPDTCEPTVVSLMTEDFDGLCAPQYSDNVVRDSNWRSRYDGAYADGCNDGKLVFAEVDTSEVSEVCFTFDIVSSNVCNFESSGSSADDLTVQYYDGSSWQTLDVFVRDGYEMVGSMTGQTFASGDWSEITYTVSDPGDSIQFRIVADFTASNEAVLVDNVEICGVIPADCGPVLGSLGDTIWYDLDQDGVQDDGETGVAGVTVELLQDGVATGRTFVTGDDGKYLFDELAAGTYAIQISDIPEGYEITTQNTPGDEELDSDVDATGLSDSYDLAAGENYFALDGGIHVSAPTVANDMGDTCADESRELFVLANDDAGLTITEVNGQAIAPNGSVTLDSGAIVTLTEVGSLIFDGTAVAEYMSLPYGTHVMDAFTYTATTAQGGEAEATVDMMICGDVKSLDDIKMMLSGTVDFLITDNLGAGDAFSITTNSVDNPLLNVTDSDNVWCIDLEGDVDTNLTLTANVFVADPNDASLGAYTPNVENLDLVNYILNQDYRTNGLTYTDDLGNVVNADITGNEIQDAIWFLTDGADTLFQPDVLAIVYDAFYNGQDFEAGEGDIVGLILAPIQETDADGNDITNYQNFIYGVEYDILADCLC